MFISLVPHYYYHRVIKKMSNKEGVIRMSEMQNKDLAIMSSLRQNARQTLTMMSRKTKIPVSTIYDWLKCHENGEDGLITRHTTLLNFRKLGFSTRATAIIKVPHEQREMVRDFLMKNPYVNTLMKINNEFDFFFEVVFREMRELEGFFEQLEEGFSVRTKKVFYVIEELKRESFLSEPMQLEMPVGVAADLA